VLHSEYRAFNKKREIVWIEAFFYPEFNEQNRPVSINQIYIDVTDRKKAEQKINLLANALESATEMISIMDLNNNFTFVNGAFLKKYGYKEDEILGKKPDILLALDNRENLFNEIYEATLKGGWKGEIVNKRKDGTEFPAYMSTSQITGQSGNVIGLIGVATDMTQMKKAEDELKQSLLEKEILLKEVYHRVKNNLQVINSLLQIQSLSLKDADAVRMFRETQRRIRIMSMIHEKLYKSKDLTKIDFSSYMFNLIDYIQQSYSVESSKIDFDINTHNIELGLNKAIPCGLIINELVSNSYKYAFEKGQKGKVYIELNLGDDDYYTLIVQDNGKGFPESIDFKNTETLGMVIVNSFADQLKGTIELDRNCGTKFIIKFPD
jgi:PAS domain S-box-containing protein